MPAKNIYHDAVVRALINSSYSTRDKEEHSMDKIDRYRMILKRIIEDYASYKPSNGQIHTEAIVDPAHDFYGVMHVGWDGQRRVHGSVIHLDIIDGKV
jgi:hypothetical protein